MVESQFLAGEPLAAVLAGETVAQEHVEAGERRTPRRGSRSPFSEITLGRRKVRGRRVDDRVVLGDHVDPAEEHGLDRFLPWPQRQRVVAQRPEIGRSIPGLECGRTRRQDPLPLLRRGMGPRRSPWDFAPLDVVGYTRVAREKPSNFHDTPDRVRWPTARPPVSPPARPATCTSGTPFRPCSPDAGANASSCASRISIPVAASPAFTEAIFDDLAWLGLSWETPVRRQSEHMADYRAALARLDDRGLIYPLFLHPQGHRRGEWRASAMRRTGRTGRSTPAPAATWTLTCAPTRLAAGEPYALRLRADVAAKLAGPLTWVDRDRGEIAATPEIFGDVVLARKDSPTSYHLAVTVDDALQGVTLVTRGEDSARRHPPAPPSAGAARPAGAGVAAPQTAARPRRQALRPSATRA